jgi:hypothetical protein
VTLCFLSKAQTRIEMQSFSFSVRETIALWIFLEEIVPATTRQTSILWRVDNMAALAHIQKEGGLKGRRLLREAERILILLDSCQLRILPAFIPSEENLQADAASHFQLVPDWHLDPQVFRQISSLWGPPRSTSSRHVSRRKRRDSCPGGLRTHRKPSTPSA